MIKKVKRQQNQKPSQSVKTFRKLFQKKFSCPRLVSLKDRNEAIAFNKQRLEVQPQQKGSLIPKLKQLQKIAKQAKKKKNQHLLTNLDIYMARKNVKKQQNHLLFLTQQDTVIPDKDFISRFNILVEKGKGQPALNLRNMINFANSKRQLTKEEKKLLIEQQHKDLQKVVKKMLGTNQDLAEEYTYTKDEGIERNLSNISNAKTQTKMINVVTNEFVKEQMKYTIRKNKSMGRFLKPH